MPHTLEIIDGKLYAYGDNGLGQLGLGHNRRVFEKSLVLTGDAEKDKLPWVNAVAGRFHSAAIKQDGSLWVWGDNRFGQLAQGIDVQLSAIPIQIQYPALEDKTKKIEIVAGYYFTLFYQYFEKGFGFGEFENFDDGFVAQHRQVIELKPKNTANKWISIQTAAKTIIGLSVEGGYKYTDWSGELFSKTYVRFETLKVGDIFTLYDPGNRNRALYKKVKTFSKGRGCCNVNAVCLHRTYRELVSQVPPNVFILENQISVYDMLDPETREEFAKPILAVTEKYGTDFMFKSAIAKHNGMSKYKGIDPWTLNAMFLMTDSNNMLDVILYDSLFFSDDINEPLNRTTTVEKISAKEVFEPYAELDLPPYLLDRSGYQVKLSSFVLGQDDNINALKDTYFDSLYGMNNRRSLSLPFSQTTRNGQWNTVEYPYLYKNNPVTGKPIRFSFTSRYGFGFPVYKTKDGKITDYDAGKVYYEETQKKNLPGCLYSGDPKYIRDIEQDDSIYDNELFTHIIDLPMSPAGDIIAVKHILGDPFLIKLAMETSGSAFKQAFMDPTRRIATKYNGDINSTVEDPGSDPMMFYTLVPDPTYNGIAASPPKIRVFYIGAVTRALIELLLSDNVSAREVNDNFGISKATLSTMWGLINNTAYPYNNDVKYAFAKLSGLFYNKLKDQPVLNELAQDILRTGISTTSQEQFFDYSTLAKYCSFSFNRPPICIFSESICINQYQGTSCWTDRTDKSKLYLFGNYIDMFKEDKSIIRYQTWSGDSEKTKNGTPVVLVSNDGRPYVAKDAYQEHATTINVIGATFDASEFLTTVQLKTPFNNNYLMGNLLRFSQASMAYQAMPFIHFNNISPITEKLQNIVAPLKS